MAIPPHITTWIDEMFKFSGEKINVLREKDGRAPLPSFVLDLCFANLRKEVESFFTKHHDLPDEILERYKKIIKEHLHSFFEDSNKKDSDDAATSKTAIYLVKKNNKIIHVGTVKDLGTDKK